jgi:hypothetical protein
VDVAIVDCVVGSSILCPNSYFLKMRYVPFVRLDCFLSFESVESAATFLFFVASISFALASLVLLALLKFLFVGFLQIDSHRYKLL